ncbi:MAG: RHS repeat-associated core domain-containing protein [Lentisphaerae bacterium]|nr:RHS repeat-associated core domain-containing protein [Lentisphaerota bacterium]
MWGLDLSGSLQGAGGIGGLLARYRTEHRYYDGQDMLIICHRPPGNPENKQTLRINENAWPAHQAHGDTLGACDASSVSNSAFLYTYDGNGNVSELLLSSAVSPPSSVVAHYEYSPFGQLIASLGPESSDNPFRFSAKYFVDELSLGDWGRRWYHPELGRWLSRDPIGQKGGMNLYVFVNNSTLGHVDKLGQMTYEEVLDKWKDLHKRVKMKKCDPIATPPPSGNITLSGSANLARVTMNADVTKVGNVISIDSYYWWHCFRAHQDAPDDRDTQLDDGASGWRKYGWEQGGATATDEHGGQADPGQMDANHWNWNVVVIFIGCAQNGCQFAAYKISGDYNWTWDAANSVWIAP